MKSVLESALLNRIIRAVGERRQNFARRQPAGKEMARPEIPAAPFCKPTEAD
jgi:hypothetical protein